MGNKEWSDDEVESEIAKAIQIVREDRFDKMLRSRLASPPSDPNGPKNDLPPTGGNGDPTGKKKKSLWWGEEQE